MSNFSSTKRCESYIQTINVLDSSHRIYKIFEENFSEDPLKLWTKNS
jgi:hypothetical protein